MRFEWGGRNGELGEDLEWAGERRILGDGNGNFIAALRDHDTETNGRPDIDR
jgi:hypothetical protein